MAGGACSTVIDPSALQISNLSDPDRIAAATCTNHIGLDRIQKGADRGPVVCQRISHPQDHAEGWRGSKLGPELAHQGLQSSSSSSHPLALPPYNDLSGN